MNTNLLADKARATLLSNDAQNMLSLDLHQAQVNDLELLLGGAYSPLSGYLTQADYQSVCDSMRLQDGRLWPLPLSLEISKNLAGDITKEDQIALRDPEGVLLAILSVEDVFEQDGKHLLGGMVEGITLPLHYDHPELRLTPATESTKPRVALFSRDILHQEELEAASQYANAHGAGLLIQSLDSGNDDIFGRIRCIKAAITNSPVKDIQLSILPATAPSDAKGVLLQAIIAANYGCSAILSSADTSLVEQHYEEISIKAAPLPEGSPDNISPQVSAEFKKMNPPKDEQGFTVFFSGLSGSGKSTIANILRVKLLEHAARKVTLLDGDLVRKNLSSELTFSREHRNLNILRISFVAGEITRHGGIAICAPIAPYDDIRKQARSLIGNYGGFILIHVATPLEVCEARDRKGLYAMARAGKISEFTGISDPYEPPEDAELTIQTTEISAEQACDQVIEYLEVQGYLKSDRPG
ncbi:MAG: adenylyl-sulfate kinase [Verrucomicrobiaceae bacterium]|nr:adenylyl-sulfate kinase [Verrucomicrobiaceae bacterium]